MFRPVFLAVVLTFGGLLVSHPAHAQPELRLDIDPTGISFPDANPTTTPLIPANASVRVRIEVRDFPFASPWSVQGLYRTRFPGHTFVLCRLA